MGRKRKASDSWMPPRVYRGKSAFEFRPVNGGAIRLCSLYASRSLVYKRYVEELERSDCKSGSFKDLAMQYQDSEKFKSLSHTTQKDYEKYHRKVVKVFGHVPVNNIRPEHIRKYMDSRTAKTQANREKAYLSAVFRWGYERGKVKMNPCIGVQSNKEKPRDRYITDDEYAAVYKHASLAIKIAMELAYLCAARKKDILSMTRDHLVADGLYIKQSKTQKKQIKRISPRLQSTLDLSMNDGTKSQYLVHQPNGQKYTISGFDSAWRLAKIEAEKQLGVVKLDFTFHDIKAKSISDYEGDKQRFSGHKTPAQVSTYDRKIEIVDSLDVPVIDNNSE